MPKGSSPPTNGRSPRKIAVIRVHPIEAARYLRRLDMKSLAEGSGIARQNLHHYIAGRYPVTETVVFRLSKYTGFPQAFFRQDKIVLTATYR